jgi:predicted permease
MRRLRAVALRLRGLFAAPHATADFDAELESHVALDTDAGIRAGLTATEARRQALIKLGGAEQTRQAHREQRTLPWLESLLRDFGYGLRTLLKHRGASAIAILSIGLGIGANATIFSMISRFILRPAPVGDPSTLLTLHTVPQGEQCCNAFSYPLYTDVRDQAKSFTDVAGYYELIPASIGGTAEPERVWGQGVTSNFFSVLELPMLLGRGFVHGDDNAPAIVLSAGLWKRHFNADPQVIGKTITLSGRTFTVVGVGPENFHGVEQILYTEFWVPLGNTAKMVANAPPQGSREYHWMMVDARLKPGVSRAQAAAELDTLAHRLSQTYPATDKDNRFVFEQAGTLPPRERENVVIFFAALSIVVLLVLCIAGANVANLLFAQAVSRQRDMAVRLALGATRARLRRQILTESLLLGLGGGTLGIVLSLWATSALSTLRLPAPIPLDVSVAVDWRVLLFTFALSVISGVLLGLAPAWAASRPQLARALKGEDVLIPAGRRISLRNLLVVAQIAMSLVLLCVTGLFLRSLQSAARIDIGFKPGNLLMLSVDPRVQNYTPEHTSQFLSELRHRAQALPGVISAVVTDVAPLSGGNRSDGFSIAGNTAKDAPVSFADLYMVTPGYFEALSMPLIAGRDIGEEAAAGPKTAVVNRAFVEKLFGSQNPIGQRVIGGNFTYQIVGVVGNAKSRTIGEETRPILYRSLKQNIADDASLMGYTLVVHTAANPTSVLPDVRRAVQTLDPAMAIYNEETMEAHVRTAYFLPRVASTLFGIFGVIGLVLAGVGLYGVMSYSVMRRTREIGIRMALGAQPGSVERLVLRQGMILTLIAVALGWPAAWMLAKMASSFLYGIQPHDVLTFAVVPPFLVIVALSACYIPARRAASVDPMQALRTE